MECGAFGGGIGAIVAAFVRPRTLPTLVAVACVEGLFALVAAALADLAGLPLTALPVLAALACGPVAGRFALAARAGATDAGFLASHHEPGVLLTFAGRHALLTLAWGVPVAGAATAAAALLGGGAVAHLLAPAAVAAAGLALLPATLIVATCTDGVGEVLSPAPWRWLASRRQDLVAVLAAAGGGIVLLVAALIPVLAVIALAAVVAGASPAGIVAGATLVAATAAGPVLLGRLVGALVADAAPDARNGDASRRDGLAGTASPAYAAALSAHAITPGADDTLALLPGRLRALEVRARAHADDAIAEAERIVHTEPANVGALALLFRLYRAAGRRQDASRAAGTALTRALNAGMHDFAAAVFRGLAEERESLVLSSSVLDRLGWVLLQRGELDGAAWCFESIALADGDGDAVRAGLAAIAAAADALGDWTLALALYRGLVERWPDTPDAAAARTAALRLADAAADLAAAHPHRATLGRGH